MSKFETTSGTKFEWNELTTDSGTWTSDKITYDDVKIEDYKIDKDQYYKDLERRQKEHLDGVMGNQHWQPCMHDSCPECVGTGIKKNGGTCIHMISCPCPKCTPYC